MFFPFGTPQTQLIKREDQPPALTLYINIPLGGERPARPMTGIYIPENYLLQPQVDLILYLHGYHTLYPSISIDRYWSGSRRFPFWPLREGVDQSGKNVILVAPTLGPRSEVGSLTDPDGLDAYLDKVLLALVERGPYQTARQSPTVGNVILACHSGGGYPMRQLALSQQRYSLNIRECWGFDCLYNKDDETLWAQWARSNPDVKLYIYYLKDTQERSKKLQLQRVPNVFVERSTARGLRAHDWIPITHWGKRLQEATLLMDKPIS